jgi:hypothetical protein
MRLPRPLPTIPGTNSLVGRLVDATSALARPSPCRSWGRFNYVAMFEVTVRIIEALKGLKWTERCKWLYVFKAADAENADFVGGPSKCRYGLDHGDASRVVGPEPAID